MLSKRETYALRYQVAKLKQHVQPLLEYLDLKNETEAREKLLKVEEILTPRGIKKVIDSIKPSDTFTSVVSGVYTAVKSLARVKTNQAQAESALKLLLKTIDNCRKESNSPDPEPIVVMKALNDLSLIYKELPQRYAYSPSHWLFEKPRVLTAIENIFKAYDHDPNDEMLAETMWRVYRAFH